MAPRHDRRGPHRVKGQPIRVLFVCTANICRSPAAEYIARQAFKGQPFQFRSAGFLYDAKPIEPKMFETLQAHGVDAGRHRSRIMDDDTLAAADVIFTMESRHLRDIVVRDQSLMAKTIPLTEAVERLRTPVTVAEFRELIADRDPSRYLDTRWDVEDPYKRSARKYRSAAEIISEYVRTTVGKLVWTGDDTPDTTVEHVSNALVGGRIPNPENRKLQLPSR